VIPFPILYWPTKYHTINNDHDNNTNNSLGQIDFLIFLDLLSVETDLLITGDRIVENGGNYVSLRIRSFGCFIRIYRVVYGVERQTKGICRLLIEVFRNVSFSRLSGRRGMLICNAHVNYFILF